jgi:transposase-like protein
MRGPYRNYPREVKERMVELYRENAVPISRLSAQFGVPIKNIKRWAENGVDRKEGAGRKRLDP